VSAQGTEQPRQGTVTDVQAQALSRVLTANWGPLTTMCDVAGVNVMVTAGAAAGDQVGLITYEAAKALHTAYTSPQAVDLAAVFAAAGVTIVPAIDPATGLPPGVDPAKFRALVACAVAYAQAAEYVVSTRRHGIVPTPLRWPLVNEPWEPSSDPLVNLAKASALLDQAAQMARLTR
jgi:hypothetical protein